MEFCSWTSRSKISRHLGSRIFLLRDLFDKIAILDGISKVVPSLYIFLDHATTAEAAVHVTRGKKRIRRTERNSSILGTTRKYTFEIGTCKLT